MTRKKYSPTRTIVSLEDFDQKESQYAFVCVPVFALEVARKLLAERGRWAATYALEFNAADAGYIAPDRDSDIWNRITANIGDFLEATNKLNCEDLIKVQRMLVAAMVGENVDLTAPLPDSVDYTEVGISPRLAAIQASIEGQATGTDGIEDELQGIMDSIGLIATIAAA